jgi:glycosyltransferase involved in cell wall biosynthesis
MSKFFSIIMMSYNQGEYINEAISSVIVQNLDFDWELLIGDDCSTDNTELVVKKWVEKYPQNIFYVRRNENIGLHANYVDLVKRSQGKYIGLLEADDFWIDSNKCKIQIQLMESNPQIAWCFTNGNVIDENGGISQEIRYTLPEVFNLNFYLENFFNPLNNTIIFRKSSEPKDYPIFFFDVAQWDTVLHYLRAINGDIGFVNILGLAWRRHKNAASLNSLSGEKRYFDWIKINNGMIDMVNLQQRKFFKNNYMAYQYLSVLSFKKKNFVKGLYYLSITLVVKPFRPLKDLRDLFYSIRN